MSEQPEDATDPVSIIPQNILEEIGKITISFSWLEDELNAFIADLLGAGMIAGQAVTFTVRNISDRIELVRTIVKIKSQADLRQEALSILTEIQTANNRRNTLIHHRLISITPNADQDLHLIEYQKKDYHVRAKPVETAFKAGELRSLRQDLRRLIVQLSDIALRHRTACGRPTREP